ncbi:23S rRNA (uracil(1939)-C(5))-methyltransferase RlmD [Otariodibacter oris]|uniref:23S rRNA (uracil(1939)-C(5))-methyltransferase RlmD n=1 Tax=Otariodibacter oris TaxID=1032623 RepID=A0A420XJK8_9PAST|nr:23S rRNA (uracil(1939)-C(5))-methyltransferase RlmD [Otariodibacter oris]QGM81656.1 23S rRNA methyltransferase [Otariodibacter oris]RKR77482.1 23S rRNA m(5)U-1939 methyltransferase [Otariodibacter oris]
MALFYSEKKAKKTTKPTALQGVTIQDLDYQGRGVAKVGGKTWFIENALPSEQVDANVIEEKRQYGMAQAVRFSHKSANRVEPDCSLYAQCGGCQMQHISLDLQRATKQKALFQRLQKLQSAPIDFQPMIVGDDQGYRRRAKLHIGWDKNNVLLGFRKKNSQEIIEVEQCLVLEKPLSDFLIRLKALLKGWKQKKALGHIELVRADNGIALLLRHIGQLTTQDRENLNAFAEQENLMLFVMTEKDEIQQWRGDSPYYQLGDLKLSFSIRDFIQVNASLNQRMVTTAIDWLELNASDRILDLFCGMGNFTLPMARFVEKVVGIEGVQPMVEQAQHNARINGIDNVQFYQTDLAQPFADKPWASQSFNKVLLDPARNGALFALDHLCELQPERIVYVSCNPATLVRDCEKLIEKGYKLIKGAMIDMFPHTGHLESVVVLSK